MLMAATVTEVEIEGERCRRYVGVPRPAAVERILLLEAKELGAGWSSDLDPTDLLSKLSEAYGDADIPAICPHGWPIFQELLES